VVPSDSPSFIGHGGLIAGDPVRRAFAEADVIVAVGCRFSSWLWDEHGPFARRHQAVVGINTDAGALGNPVMHRVAMVADARRALDDLLAELGAAPTAAADDWLPGLRELRRRYEARFVEMSNEADPVMHPAALGRAIADTLPPDALAVYDGGHTTFWSNDLTPVRAVRTRFHDPGMSQLGFGLPYALALQLLHPKRTVVNITGDGSFGFTLSELDTARRYRLPVITLIHNNGAWGIIRAGQRGQLDFELATDLEGTDYAAIARGFGCHGEVVTAATEVAPAFERARASGLPAVIDCRTRFVPHPAMPHFGSMNRFGFDALTRSGNP